MTSNSQHIPPDRTVPPSLVDTPSILLPELRTRTLSNGIELMIYDKCKSPVNYLSVITRGGQAEAPSAAVAALTAVMQREGSIGYPGEEIASVMDFNGSWLKGISNPHHTHHAIYSLNSRLLHVLPIFCDMLFRPTFPQDTMEVRREALAKNLEISSDDVSYIAKCRADEMIMGIKHPLATIDTPEQVRNLTSEHLAEFHNRYIIPSNSIVYLCGDITYDIEEMVADTFGTITTNHSKSPLNVVEFNPEPSGTDTIHHPGALQSAVIMNLPAIPRSHPDYIPLHITVSALGGYFGSRLMQSIREEKGLTYGIDATLYGYIDGAHIQIAAETDNSHVHTLIDEVRHEMLRLASDPCHGDELIRLRRSLNSSLASVTDSPFSTIDYYISMLTSGIAQGYFQARRQAIADITPEIIAEMATKYLNPDLLRIAVAGDVGKM